MRSTLEKRSIEDIDLEDVCTGCGTCVGICPRNAISLEKNDQMGIYLPKILDAKCNHCGICYDCCPGHSVDYTFLNKFSFGTIPSHSLIGCVRNCSVAYATNKEIRYNSSSGGLITEILIYALEEGLIDGALVTRMNRDNPLEPEPFIAKTRGEIVEAARSKYCPVPANIAIKFILDNEGKYAVVGLPCHIQGIRKAEMLNKKLKNRIVLHLGLFCAGTKSFLATECLLQKRGINPSSVTKIEYRGRGWPGSMLISTSVHESALIIPKSDYYDLVYSSFTPWRCMLCIDHTAELADLSFGDAWLQEITCGDNIGSSIVLSRSQIGKDIINDMVKKNLIEIKGISTDDVVKSQGGIERKRRHAIRRCLSKILRKNAPKQIVCIDLPKPSLMDWAQDLFILCPRTVLANNRRTIWLLTIFLSIIKNSGKIIRKIKMITYPPRDTTS
jgi:coenzyme F420 hydrogenase subunit beta